MSNPQFLRQPTVQRLPEILEELRTGALRVPKFQRAFVWTAEQRLALLNSIYEGLPTGSLMVWRTTREVPRVDLLGPFKLPPLQPGAGPFQYLLDGLQRMTTLFAALGEALWTRAGSTALPVSDGVELEEDDEGKPWAVVFDCGLKTFVFEGEPKAEGSGLRMPLNAVLDEAAYDDWRELNKPTREDAAILRGVRTAFLDYLVPITPLATDDLAVVTKTFKRVNSSGTPMDELHMARALSWSDGFDLIDAIEGRRGVLEPNGWGQIEPVLVMQVLAGVVGLSPIEFDVEELAKKVKDEVPGGSRYDPFDDPIEAAVEAIRTVVLALKGMGFVSERMLPAKYALVLASVVAEKARRLRNRRMLRSELLALTAWIARNLIYDRFSQPTHVLNGLMRSLEADLGLVKARKSKERQAEEARKFNLAWSRSKTIAAVMASQSPCDASGTPYPDPAGLLARHGSEALPQLLRAGAAGLPRSIDGVLRSSPRWAVDLLRPANRLLCSPEDVAALRVRICAGELDADFLRAHLLDAEAVRALRAGDVPGFMSRRRDLFRTAEVAWASSHGATDVVVKRGPTLR
jgi:hypothetical protein